MMRGGLLNTIPGIILSLFVGLIGIFFSDYVGIEIMGFKKSPISSIMLAIIIGLFIGNIINVPNVFKPGIDFSIKRILRFGIICLGIRIGLGDIVTLGMVALPVIIVCLAAALAIVIYLSKKINVSSRMAALIAVGTSICGATAIVATAPAIDANKEEVTYAIANITIFGIIAMFVYPFLANYLFSGNEYAAGLFIGTSIHETAQVAGAGLIYAEQFNAAKVLDIATVTKLVRNTSMLAIIPLMAFVYHKRSIPDSTKKNISILGMFPIFIFGFIAMGLFRTIGDISLESSGYSFNTLNSNNWSLVIESIKQIAEISLTIAMASLGLSTNLKSLTSLGVKPFYLGFVAATSVGIVSIITINILIV
jgi:uncharacterized integral membrane protein (TIGR00698 family)